MNVFVSLGIPPVKQPPFPVWPSSLIAIIEEALRKASLSVEARLGGKRAMLDADENTITNALQKNLCALLENGTAVTGFSTDIFQTPTRDSSVENYSGKKINKKPDITFYRVGKANPYDGWFCECKIFDAAHSLHDYLYEGLIRFVDGTYAWATPQAQMIAYVRDSSRTVKDLINYFSTPSSKSGSSHGQAMSLDRNPVDIQIDLLSTSHNRRFLLETVENQPPPGSIELHHLWLTL